MALGGAARGEERLMMPFSCKIEQGKIVLAPSRTQSYRIYGAREHRRFTTCSPARRDRCRSWRVHRFDLDCGGVRIGWPSVVAAMAPWARGANRSYAARTPMAMGPRAMSPRAMSPQAMGPRRYVGPAIPRRSARPYIGAPGPYGPPRPYVARPAPRQMVDLPAGFAPVPFRLAYFVRVPGPSKPGPIARKTAAPAGPAPEIAANDKSNAPAGSPAASASKKIDHSPKPVKADGVAVARQAKSDRLPLAKAPAPSAGNDITSAIPKPRKAQPGSAWLNPTGAAGVGFAAFVVLAMSLAMMLFLWKSMDKQN